jgi:hypothetical protein
MFYECMHYQTIPRNQYLTLFHLACISDFPLVPDSDKTVLAVGEMEVTKSSSKANLHRFDVTLRTFTRITIPTAMERLRMHCQNMEKVRFKALITENFLTG